MYGLNLAVESQAVEVGSLCDAVEISNNNLLYTDDTRNSTGATDTECFCTLTKLTAASITFRSDKFLCETQDSWQMEFHQDGCLQESFTCTDVTPAQEQTFVIPATSEVEQVFIKMVKTTPQAMEAYYSLRITAIAEDSCKYCMKSATCNEYMYVN